MAHTILIADDDPSVLLVLTRVLERASYVVEGAASGEAALLTLPRRPFDLVLLDLHLGGRDGLSVLAAMRKAGHAQPVIMMSGQGTIENAVSALQLGALDFLEKPVDPDRLLTRLRNALRLDTLARCNAELESELHATQELVGTSDVMQQLRALIAKAAPSEGRVLITGENGTGKELVARAIHRGSRRAEQVYVKVNCAAIPSELIESELFGHEKGAFTGAASARRGKVEAADRGTLFLDEVGDMSLPMQAKLLRVLQEGELERVGGNTPIKVDVRVIAATNRDLERMVHEGKFREDLFYRLNVIRMATPPLRARKDDLAALARLFLDWAARRNHRAAPALSDAALVALSRHDYPGNVRELQNLIERLVILAEGDAIDGAEVQAVLPTTGAALDRPGGTARSAEYERGTSFALQVERAQRAILQGALVAHDFRMTETALALGLERSHLYKKCKALGLEVGQAAGSSRRS